MDMGQGKGAGLEVQGETLENVCGQWWCLGEMSLAMAMMSHSPASGVSGATHTLHRLKEEVDPSPPSITPTFLWAQTLSCPGWTLHASPQPGGEVRQSGRARVAASAAGASSGGAGLWYACK